MDRPLTGNAVVDSKIFMDALLKNTHFRENFAGRYAGLDDAKRYEFVEFITQSLRPRTYCPSCTLLQMKIDLHACKCQAAEKLGNDLSEAYKRVLSCDNNNKKEERPCEPKLRKQMVFEPEAPLVPDLKEISVVIEASVEDLTGEEIVVVSPIPIYVPPALDVSLKMDAPEILELCENRVANLEENIDAVAYNIIAKVEEDFNIISPEIGLDCVSSKVHTTVDDSAVRSGWFMDLIDYWWTTNRVKGKNHYGVKAFTLFNFRECLDKHPDIKCTYLGGGLVYSYAYRNRKFKIDYGEMLSAYAKACALVYDIAQEQDLDYMVTPYDIDYFDFALVIIIFYHVSKRDTVFPFPERQTMLLHPGLERVFKDNEYFKLYLQSIVNNATFNPSALKAMESSSDINTLVHILQSTSVERGEIEKLFTTVGVHRAWLRCRMILALHSEFGLPDYLQEWCQNIVADYDPTVIPFAQEELIDKMLDEALKFVMAPKMVPFTFAFYYDTQLLRRIKRLKTLSCVHNNLFYALDKHLPCLSELIVYKALRLDSASKVGEQWKWTLVKDVGYDGVSLETATKHDTQDLRPLILVASFSRKLLQQLIDDKTAGKNLWKVALNGSPIPSPSAVKEYDNFSYGMLNCRFKRRTDKVGINVPFSNKTMFALSALKKFDRDVWIEREQIRMCLNYGKMFVNGIREFNSDDPKVTPQKCSKEDDNSTVLNLEN